MIGRSRCKEFEPNDWVAYVDAHTRVLLHVGLFYNPGLPANARRNPPPPGGWDPLPDDEVV